MEKKENVLVYIEQAELSQFLDLLKNNGIDEIQYSSKKSLEGDIPVAMVLIATMKYIFPVLKDLLLEKIKKGNIGYIKIGEIELRDVTYENALKMFEKFKENSPDE